MKKTKLLALVLCLAMLATVLAGCANSTDTPAVTETQAEASTPPSEDQAPDTQAPDSAPDAPPADQPTIDLPDEPVPGTPAISYPLTEGDLTLSYWYYAPGYVEWVTGNDAFMCIPYAEEATGVHLAFTEVAENVAREQFNLMIISEIWCDLMPISNYYTGGLSQAFADEVVLDMSDYIYEYMPDYVNVLDRQTDAVKDAVLTEGKMLAFATIADGSYSGDGLVTRYDWLSTIDYTFDKDYITLTELEDLLRILKDEFGAEYPFFAQSDGSFSGTVAASFDTTVPSLSGSSSPSASVYVKDGQIASGWTADGTRAYVEWLSHLIDEGLVNNDFATDTHDRGWINTSCANGIIGMWGANADKIDELTEWANDENKGIQAMPIPPVVADDNTKGDTKWKTEVNLVSMGMSVSADSDKAELACKYMNYFWTEEGTMLANYGVKGLSYDTDANGDWHWLDLVAHEPQGANAEMASTLYTFSRFVSYYNDHDKLMPTFSENAVNAIDIWTQEGTSERTYPSFAGLTSDETDRNSTMLNDIASYGMTELLSFITGTKPLNDETWNAYLAQMDTLGMPKVLAVYQNAYEEYLAGERRIASNTGGGGPGGPPPM